MVLIRGRPKASVLCDEQNMAAMVSPRENPRLGKENNWNSPPSDSRCSKGKSVNKSIVWRKSSPSPLEKALQKAFHAMLKRITCTEIRRTLDFNTKHRRNVVSCSIVIAYLLEAFEKFGMGRIKRFNFGGTQPLSNHCNPEAQQEQDAALVSKHTTTDTVILLALEDTYGPEAILFDRVSWPWVKREVEFVHQRIETARLV